MKFILRLFLMAAFFQINNVHAQTCTMSGTYKIGPGGNYTTLTLASSALRTNGMSGAVILELMATYANPSETNINFGSVACMSATKTLTIRPEAGAANLVVSNSIGGPLITLSNARYVTIDGRAGGTGNTIALSLANYSVSGNVVIFSADASFNTLQYLNIKGATSSQTSGLINFGGTALNITNGNNDNLISNCTISAFNGSPANCIYSLGSAGKKNVRNRIVNCNIKDFSVSSTGKACGILLGVNNSAWEITGNSFYQSQPAYVAGTSTVAININDINSSGFLVNNNFIGGTAPFCGGAPFVLKGGLRGIVMSTATSGYSDVQGNTIQNIEWLEYLNPDDFSGIVLLNGKLRCGTTQGNIIGSPSQNASILARASLYERPYITGIFAGSADGIDIFDTVLIKNNIISGIKAIPNPGSEASEMYLYGIFLQKQASGFIEISNNTIGSNSIENSLDNSIYGPLNGIYTQAAGTGNFNCNATIRTIISGNTISNLNGGAPRGINVDGGQVIIKDNLVQKLTNVAANNYVAIGIAAIYNCPGSSIAGNTIRNLYCNSTGIFADYSNGLVFENNFIHSFQRLVSYGTIKGIHIYQTINNPSPGFLHGNFKIRNNMIRFGVDSSGSAETQNINVTGIEAPLDSTVITHNTIFLGGNNNTADIGKKNLSINRLMAAGNRITNNILVNENRTSSNDWDPAASLFFKDDIVSLSGLFLDHNLYYGLAECNTAVYKNVRYRGLGLWRTITGMEANSIYADPNFKNAKGDINTVDLNLKSPTPAEAKGILESDVLLDFDLETRAVFSPVDIGADAGNYMQANTANGPFATICPGGNTSLLSDKISQFLWYQWQLDTGTGFTDISDNSYYSGTISSKLQLTGIPATWYGYRFRCFVDGVAGTMYSLKFENKWTGAVDNSWHNPSNWSCGMIPDGNTDVIINSGTVLVNANAICRTLTLSTVAIFTVAPGVIFTITN